MRKEFLSLSGGLEFGPGPASSPPFHSSVIRIKRRVSLRPRRAVNKREKETEERKKEKKERNRKVLFLVFLSSKGPFAKDCFARVKTSSNLLAKLDVRAK